MKRKSQKTSPKEQRGAAQLRATISRINAALQMLSENGDRFEKISHLADEVSRICNIHRTLLLRQDKSYRKCLDKFPELLGAPSTPEATLSASPHNQEINPLHPVMIRNAQLEQENVKLRNIVDDLSMRPLAAAQPSGTASKASEAPEYQREFELTCQLVDKILDHKRAIRVVDDGLSDLSDISGIPKLIADSKLLGPYLTWKATRARIQ